MKRNVDLTESGMFSRGVGGILHGMWDFLDKSIHGGYPWSVSLFDEPLFGTPKHAIILGSRSDRKEIAFCLEEENDSRCYRCGGHIIPWHIYRSPVLNCFKCGQEVMKKLDTERLFGYGYLFGLHMTNTPSRMTQQNILEQFL